MYKQKLRNLKREMILEIRKTLLNRKVESIRMTSPFKIYSEQKFGDDYTMVPLIVEEMDIYGKVLSQDPFNNPLEIDLEELSVYDLAHLYDVVTKDDYKITEYIEETTDEPSV